MIQRNRSEGNRRGAGRNSGKPVKKKSGRTFKSKNDKPAGKVTRQDKEPRKVVKLKSNDNDHFIPREKAERPVRKNKAFEKPYIKDKDYTKPDKKNSGFFGSDNKERNYKKPIKKDSNLEKPARRSRIVKKNDEPELSYNDKKKNFSRKGSEEIPVTKGIVYTDKMQRFERPHSLKNSVLKKQERTSDVSSAMRLNQYLAHAGICSRREADKLISSGVVMINGQVVTELGTKVKPGDSVQYGGQTITGEKKVYLLLNKPKGYITTFDDPQERETVMALVKNACRERIYPVGRLDRNTTGLLLFTNDGEMTKKLTHPKHGVRKVYHVILDKPLTRADMKTIEEGIELEDELITVDSIAYVKEETDKTEIGMELHSGKNRVVRRIFESLGYNVEKLDRVIFAGLTKKDLPRGRWRFLTEQEVNFLKMIG